MNAYADASQDSMQVAEGSRSCIDPKPSKLVHSLQFIALMPRRASAAADTLCH